MNLKIKKFAERISYVFGANMFSMILSIATTLLIPRFFGEDTYGYGYFQLYMFYVGYVGLFHLGWCDGIFLKIGGSQYQDLDKRLYCTQFWLLMGMELIFGIIIWVLSIVFQTGRETQFIVFLVALNLIVDIPVSMLSQILHGTLRIREYAVTTILNRVLFVVFVFGIIVSGFRDFKLFAIGDLGARLITLILLMYYCRDIVKNHMLPIKTGLLEAKANIGSGFHLLFSNLANGFITDISRIAIINKWDVSAFGKISLTLKITNFIMTFISAVSLVLYPTLRRVDEKALSSNYSYINTILMAPLWGGMLFNFPMQALLKIWLPQYADSLRYMALLLPVCIYACKINLLILTYMKVLRLEKLILKVNLISLIFACVTTFISVYLFENLELCILSIVINKMMCSNYSEYVLARHLPIQIGKNIALELIMTAVFICTNWYIGGILGIFFYSFGYLGYILYKKKDIAACRHLTV